MVLTSEQYKTISEIMGSVSVSWFTAGIVSPFFFNQIGLQNFVLYLILGISMFGVFGIISLYFSSKIKK